MAQKGRRDGTFGAADAVVNCRDMDFPATVVVIPNGSTAKAQVSATPDAYENPGAAVWIDWDPGAVSANSMTSVMSQISAIRFQRTAGATACSYQILF